LSYFLKDCQKHSLWKTYRKALERHLPYEITRCYLPLDTGERAPY